MVAKENVKQKPQKPILLGRPGNDVKIGIVGMPNVGKSTIFNILSGLSVPAENFPFCTIDPSQARVKVPDKRFEHLCDLYKPKSRVPASLTITDIAGLVKGASENKGLGNEFLSHIYSVDGIFHLVRAFSDKSIQHVEGDVEPVRDLEIINNELRMKDIEILEKKMSGMTRLVASSNKTGLKEEFNCYEKLLETLKNKKHILSEHWTVKEIDFINALYLLSAKPVVFLVNVGKSSWKSGKSKWLLKIKEWVDKNHPCSTVIPFCADFEKNLQKMGSEEQKKFLEENKLRSQIRKIIRSGYSALSLCHFFTCGKKEVKCWTVRNGTKAKKAAGVIHTDFEKFFICAAVMSFKDLKEFGSEQAVRSKGKYRTEGKEYLVKDGDIILFKHNAGGAKKK